MNRSNKLSLFLGLGCKPMKDVNLHHPHWIIYIGNVTMQKVEQSKQVREALQFEAQKVLPEMVMSIEAIPEKLTGAEIEVNIDAIHVRNYEITAGQYVRGSLELP